MNAIFGVYHDIDPSITGTMSYAILGSYPCRTFVVNWNQIAMYSSSCNSLLATHQIVLYESTNVIEVYVQSAPLCSSWNSGNKCIGIQNSTGTVGYTPSGRNTGAWSATNEAWRFTPNGTPNYSVSWWQGFTQISTTPTINVCPPTTTTYTAQVIYDCCTGNQVVLTDDVTVNVNNSIGLTINPANPTICNGGSTTLTATSTNPAATFQWSSGGSTAAVTVSPTTTTTYTVTATTPGCTTQASATVTVSTSPTVSVTSTSICNGQSATLTASGATTYSWSTGGSGSSITVSPSSTTTYTVTGSNSGCTASATGVVTLNPAPNAQISGTVPSSCGLSNGSATATGGTSYLWNNGQAFATATNLAAGTYTVTVTNASACTASTTATINSIASPTATASSTNETCGQSNGTAIANPSGTCTGGFTYLWNSIPQQSTQTATGLPAGTYTVTVSCNGCTTTASTTLTNLAGPSIAITSITNSTCGLANGSAVSIANGGSMPYTYHWNCVPAQYSPTMSNVPAGSYNVSVTDANGCVASNTCTITTTSAPIPVITGVVNADCNQSDGSASLNVTSGTPPYSFYWNSSPSQSSQNLQNVPTGTYNVTVTDNSGCTGSTTVLVPQNAGPTATTATTSEICGQGNGTATVIATGGTGTYTYLWNNGQTTQTATGLHAGSYVVTVDDGTCTVIISANVLSIPGPTAGFSAHPTVLTVMDNPVSFLNNSSGTIVSCLWNFGDGSPTETGNTVTHLYNIIGTYLATLIVTDNNGCMDTISDTIKVKDIYAIYIPNAFSPNGDGINDIWYPKGISIDANHYDCKIFDRWGKLIFQTNNPAEGWNGTYGNDGDVEKVTMDVYVYRIVLKEVDGPKHEYIGRVAILP
jgi:gliding motility-associated-like protein